MGRAVSGAGGDRDTVVRKRVLLAEMIDDQLAEMARAGVMGFKCFMCPSGIDEFPHVERRDLEVAMPILRAAGVPLLVHAELWLADEVLRIHLHLSDRLQCCEFPMQTCILRDFPF